MKEFAHWPNAPKACVHCIFLYLTEFYRRRMKVCIKICWRQQWGWSVWERSLWTAKRFWRQSFRRHVWSSAASPIDLRGEATDSWSHTMWEILHSDCNIFYSCGLLHSSPLSVFRLHDSCSSTQQTNNLLQLKLNSVVRLRVFLSVLTVSYKNMNSLFIKTRVWICSNQFLPLYAPWFIEILDPPLT